MRRIYSILYLLIFLILISIQNAPAQKKNAIYYNQNGWSYLKRGDTFNAILYFKSALKKNPRYKNALIGLAKAYLLKNSFQESNKLYNKVLKLEPNNHDASIGSGLSLIGLGKYDQALNTFQKIINKHPQSISAHYGVAYLYYMMNKTVWAERKISTIFKINPYHYDTLVLKSKIMSDRGRLEEAEDYLKKAISTRREFYKVYLEYGILLLKKYFDTNNHDFLKDSLVEFSRATSIFPGSVLAHRYIGYIFLLNQEFKPAIESFQKALNLDKNNYLSYYYLAVAYQKNNNIKNAVENYTKAYNLNPDDELIINRLENSLVIYDYKIGHPLRIKLSQMHYKLAQDLNAKNLTENAVFHYRRGLYLNPMFKEIREGLRDYYELVGYYRFYLDELKRLYRLYNIKKYRDKLNVAVIKRREKLYYKEGYSQELPERDVPKLLVLDLQTPGDLTSHLLAGEDMSDAITFALQQYGRVEVKNVTERNKLLNTKNSRMFKNVDQYLRYLSQQIKNKKIDVDYILYGQLHERGKNLQVDLKLLDFSTGIITENITLSENGRNSLSRLSIRTARQVFEKVKYKGHILKIKNNNIIINLGKYDGLKEGDIVYAFQKNDILNTDSGKTQKKILFKVNQVDTLVAKASVINKGDIDRVIVGNKIFPLQLKKAKLIK